MIVYNCTEKPVIKDYQIVNQISMLILMMILINGILMNSLVLL